MVNEKLIFWATRLLKKIERYFISKILIFGYNIYTSNHRLAIMNEIRFMKFYTYILVLMAAIGLNAQWQQTQGPYGGPLISIATHNGDLYAGTSRGNIFRHSEGEWRKLSNVPYMYELIGDFRKEFEIPPIQRILS
jgi:hypothetical protein